MEDIFDLEKGLFKNQNLSAIYMTDDKDFFMFGIGWSDYLIYEGADGCCGGSHVESISGIDFIGQGIKVLNIETKEVPAKVDDNDYGEYWGWKITTEKGICDIEFRYDGNYGGRWSRVPLGSYFISQDDKNLTVRFSSLVNNSVENLEMSPCVFKKVLKDFE